MTGNGDVRREAIGSSVLSARSHRDVALAFGAVLRVVRRSVHATQEALAERADIDRTYPSLLERGLRQPTLGIILRIAHALDVSPLILVRMTITRLNRESKART
jgi:transcriptional regulator with XRE-family HTH domain